MKALAIALSLVLSSASYAEGTDSDIPLLESDRPVSAKIYAGKAVVSEEGDIVYLPEGLFLNKMAAIIIGKDLKRLNTENEELKKAVLASEANSGIDIKLVAMGVGVGVLAGILVGAIAVQVVAK